MFVLVVVFCEDSIVGINLYIVMDRDRGVVVDGQVVGCIRRCKKYFDFLEVKLLFGYVFGFCVQVFWVVEFLDFVGGIGIVVVLNVNEVCIGFIDGVGLYIVEQKFCCSYVVFCFYKIVLVGYFYECIL